MAPCWGLFASTVEFLCSGGGGPAGLVGGGLQSTGSESCRLRAWMSSL